MPSIHSTSIRSIAERSAVAGSNSTSATAKQRTSATCISESGKSRGTQARKKAKCEYCYRVHKRCAGTFPCDRCIKAGCAVECTEHKRQRHNAGHSRRGDVLPLASATVISSLRSSSSIKTKNNQNDSSTPMVLDIQQTMAIPCSHPALPAPTVHLVLSDPRSAPGTSYVPHVDTVSSPSPTDSSTTTDENTTPIKDLLDACLVDLTSAEWRNETEVWAWDTPAQQFRSPAISQMLLDDPQLWGLLEALVRLLVTFAVWTPYPPPCIVADPVRRRAWLSACFPSRFSWSLLDLTLFDSNDRRRPRARDFG
ncbi:hypothetical protein LXA43DRAFT_1036037 [Ganoderma leucocontextum]|nr:hypothetical protein LXA43DRAFT_1036037 [Ganoderma leucocontextum]